MPERPLPWSIGLRTRSVEGGLGGLGGGGTISVAGRDGGVDCSGSRYDPEGPCDPEFPEHQDVEEFGAGSRASRAQVRRPH